MCNSRLLASIAVLTILGLTTSLMLKILDSVWKAIGTAVELFVTSYASLFFFGYLVELKDFGALCVMASGVALYAGVFASDEKGLKHKQSGIELQKVDAKSEAADNAEVVGLMRDDLSDLDEETSVR
eukprot:gnl/MRDRNA2_/MRDRNA2_85354_c0_seq3.p1 gnl/MRDRNA2_/MRDRNA2_85354_c0~~gnl/MRDRNA2_/MRDRNA2_85354_c0_seq3.p1  ORF type:complete len:127 (+),score=26.73 gnl/MRDRNA2_/MRDRNA2_85354_c0_seq3:251-631(+)